MCEAYDDNDEESLCQANANNPDTIGNVAVVGKLRRRSGFKVVNRGFNYSDPSTTQLAQLSSRERTTATTKSPRPIKARLR